MTQKSNGVSAAYNGVTPQMQGPPSWTGHGAAVLGRTTIGQRVWLDNFATIRADGNYVEIGDDFSLGEHGTVHIAHEMNPTRIGDRVSVGAHAVVHACDVGDDCVVEDRAVILDGATVGAGAIISAGSIVFPRSELEGGWLYEGSPAKPVSPVTREQLEARHATLQEKRGGESGAAGLNTLQSADAFIAPSALVSGDVRCGADSSIWYGCDLKAGNWHIEIGDCTNVQDNSFIICENDNVTIAEDVTIGHNVTLIDCKIESNTLIGIGSRILPGTVVESDVLVASGSETEVGQRLTSGSVWAGIPARPIAKMDERKRFILSATLPIYADYARHFRTTAHNPIS